METKQVRVGSDGEALHVLHIALVLTMLRGVVHAAWGEPAVGEGRGGIGEEHRYRALGRSGRGWMGLTEVGRGCEGVGRTAGEQDTYMCSVIVSTSDTSHF